MKVRLVFGLCSIVVCACLLVSPARAINLFFFGDSLSDPGNGCLLPFVLQQQDPGSVAIPEDLADECRDARYFLGRATQGSVWAEVLASGLSGTPLSGTPLHTLLPAPIAVPFFPEEMIVSPNAPPATLLLLSGLLSDPGMTPLLFGQGANFAVGGAETEDLLGPGASLEPLESEVGAFLFLLQTSQLQADSEDLYLLWIGGNDIRRQVKASGTVQVEVGVARTIAAIQALRDLVGAQHVVVFNLPDVGLSRDLTQNQQALATAFTRQWNQALASALDYLVSFDGLDVTRLDAFCLTNSLIAFERLNTGSSCLGSNAYPECSGLLLFDDIHATAAVHRNIGRAAQAAQACSHEADPVGFRGCVVRFTGDLSRQGLLTRGGRLAINQCVGNGTRPGDKLEF